MINGNDINCGRKEEKCRMFDSDEISERLTNRLIRKKTAELGEIEEYQRRIKKTKIYLRNFIIVFIIIVVIIVLCLKVL